MVSLIWESSLKYVKKYHTIDIPLKYLDLLS